MLPACVCSRQVNECCMQARNPVSAISQLHGLWQSFVSSHPIFRPLPLLLASSMNCASGTELACAFYAAVTSKLKQDREEKPIHAVNPARAQILCGRQFAAKPELGEEGCPMGRDPCQGKQTNKSRAELEEAVHVISKKSFV
jgi:hypothetical protein